MRLMTSRIGFRRLRLVSFKVWQSGLKLLLTPLDQHGCDIEPFIATFRVQVARERTRTWRQPAEGVDLRDQ